MGGTPRGESGGGPFRVGSRAPDSPDGSARCGAPWPGPWEDRVEARPECEREQGHPGPHHVEQSGFDGRCFGYRWGPDTDPTSEPC